ncbi:VanZ family protein [Propionibacteriaceae bacterium Y2011]
MTWRRLLILLGIVATIVQCYGLYGPAGTPSAPGLPLDKVAHVLGFALPVGLFVAARIDWRWVAAVAVGQALVSEFVQGALLSERTADPLDLLADVIGIVLGVAGGRVSARRMAGRQPADSGDLAEP